MYADFKISRAPNLTRQRLPYFFVLCCWCAATSLTAQDINIQSVAIEQGKVTMKFILEDPNPERRYTLRLYSSMDNYVQPLQNVSGNIGVDQRVGGNKQIVWDAAQELKPGFNDYISFEVRAFIYVPFIEMEDLSQYGAFKRGKEYTLKWSGGRGDNVLNLELYKGDKKTGTLFKDVANTGSWPMILPNNTKPGRDYYFKITDQNNNDEQVNTGLFAVKARVPLVAKILVGGGLAILISELLPDNSEATPIPLPNDPKN